MKVPHKLNAVKLKISITCVAEKLLGIFCQNQGNSVSLDLCIKISWGSMPSAPPSWSVQLNLLTATFPILPLTSNCLDNPEDVEFP